MNIIQKSGSYHLRYKSVESDKNDKVIVDYGSYPDRDSVIFKDKYGVKLKVVDGNILSFTGVSQPDTNYIYAYRGDKKIGKLFLNTYQRKIYNVVLVSVNEAKILHEKNVDKAVKKVEESLNKVYNQCAVSFKISHTTISIDDLTSFSHGGSGILSVYNEDQKKVLRAFDNQMEDGVFYLFFIDNVTDKKDGNGTLVSGYMPRGYNAGFIYDGGSPHTIAHELGHGVAGLEHVFENSSISGKTANLMDYASGEELWHFQWDQIQDPGRVWMKWNKDEGEGELSLKPNSYVCFMKFVNAFCYALQNHQPFIYNSKKDLKIETSAVTPSNHNKTYPTLKGMITVDINISKDLNITPTSKSLSDYSNFFTIECNNGANPDIMFEYLIDTYNDRKEIMLSNIMKITDQYDNFLEDCSMYPEPIELSKLDINIRNVMLKRLNKTPWVSESYIPGSCNYDKEQFEIDLIKSTPNADRDKLWLFGDLEQYRYLGSRQEINKKKEEEQKMEQYGPIADFQISEFGLNTMQFINAFCYSYINKTPFTYKFGHDFNAKNGARIKFKESDTEISFEILGKKNFDGQNLTTDQLSSYSQYFTLHCRDVSSQELFNYLIDSYSSRMQELESNIFSKNPNSKNLIECLLIYPKLIDFSQLELPIRKVMLKRLSNTPNFGIVAYSGSFIIELIKSTPYDQIKEMLSFILNSEVFSDLCNRLYNDNYLRFLAELTKKWTLLNRERIKVVQSDISKGDCFLYWDRENDNSKYVTYDTEYNNGKISIDYWFGDRLNVFLSANLGWGSSKEYHQDVIDAQGIVLLHCKTTPEVFFTNAKHNQTLIIPGFLFHAMNEKFLFDRNMDYFESAITVVSFVFGVGDLFTLAQKGNKIFVIVNAIMGAANVAMSFYEINLFINDHFPDEVKLAWTVISKLLDVKSALTFDASTVLEVSEAFCKFNGFWATFKAGYEINKYTNKENDIIEEIDSFVRNIESEVK